MKFVTLVGFALLLGSCTTAPVILAGDDPNDPAAPVPPIRYAPVTAGTVDYRPVEPKPWLELNKDVAPDEEGEQ